MLNPSSVPGGAPERDARASADLTTEDRTDRGRAGDARARRPGLVTIFPRAAEGSAPACWLVASAVSAGRARESAVRLDDSRVSRLHVAVEPRAGGLHVRDLDSRHGTFVDGARVAPGGALAAAGSVIRVGDTLLLVVDDVERHRSPARRIAGARLGLPGDMVAGPLLAEVWDQAIRLARLAEPALILGETGSGKESIARIIHAFSGCRGRFVGINVAALPEALFEAELFGHERGAFTGAAIARPGAFREATDGVLFLDEVGDLRPELQVKLLRAIDLRCVRPLGAGGDVPISARVVSATSRDLRAACEAGEFRADLWYRLSASVIRVPPLRERPDDVILLAEQALGAQQSGPALSAEAAEALLLADWEGNARQLQQAVARAAAAAADAGDRSLRAEHLSDLGPLRAGAADGDSGRGGGGALTRERIELAMANAGGVALRAAAQLGVSRTTLYNAMKRLKLDRDSLPGRGSAG